MVVNSRIRDSNWLTFTLSIVNFNYVFLYNWPQRDLDVQFENDFGITHTRCNWNIMNNVFLITFPIFLFRRKIGEACALYAPGSYSND